MLNKVEEHIAPQKSSDSDDLLLVASSFEPRCCRSAELLQRGGVKNSLIFRYSDTLDSSLGIANTGKLWALLKDKSKEGVDILDCSFLDPFGPVRMLRAWVADNSPDKGRQLDITIDVSCFTKLHLLLLLQTLETELRLGSVRILYTEPISYAVSFRRPLSYGIHDTVYIPLNSPCREPGQSALLVFLGHEALRAERVIDEIEPDLSVLIVGKPGFTAEMLSANLELNKVLIERVRYNRQYRLLFGSSRDFVELADSLEGVMLPLENEGFGTFYLGPLGTKLQALSFELIRRANPGLRFLIAYAIPKRYDRKYYSQGTGPTWSAPFPRQRRARPQQQLRVGGIYYSDPFDVPLDASEDMPSDFFPLAKSMIIGTHRERLSEVFGDDRVSAAYLCDGSVFSTAMVDSDFNNEYIIGMQRRTGRVCYCISREDFLLAHSSPASV